MTQLDLIPPPAPPAPFQIGTDRPIIFSGPMIRALLDGRKTKTRRLLKLAGRAPDYIGPRGCEDDPTCWGWGMPDGYFVTVEGDEKDHAPGWRNGWRDWAGAYAPGDRLWVREGWNVTHKRHLAPGEVIERTADDCAKANGGFAVPACDGVVYRATGSQEHPTFGKALWRSPIHMPRWASRLTLIVTDVRVQRLQDISEADAVAEGVGPMSEPNDLKWEHYAPHGTAFRDLWNSLHGTDAWDANPWVVALTFTVHRCNIDAAKEAEE